ncbi:MarR family winged helix-turn-helix transcriptional regulator [Vibrio sp.]|uniref:MarR family winged helix-turn-helix transcriptional regulator n=1 Tax=Vibrio sp. TaxID=678 RepID=UPI003D0A93BE
MATDHVDVILQQWQQQRPDLDCSSMAIIGRINRLSSLLNKQLAEVFKAHQLSAVEFDILATLRRSGNPQTPTELYQALLLSSGAMSTRLEQLVQRGLIERLAGEGDRRSCRVQLTEQGLQLIDAALESHVANMERILADFPARQREALASLLQQLSGQVEG